MVVVVSDAAAVVGVDVVVAADADSVVGVVVVVVPAVAAADNGNK